MIQVASVAHLGDAEVSEHAGTAKRERSGGRGCVGDPSPARRNAHATRVVLAAIAFKHRRDRLFAVDDLTDRGPNAVRALERFEGGRVEPCGGGMSTERQRRGGP